MHSLCPALLPIKNPIRDNEDIRQLLRDPLWGSTKIITTITDRKNPFVAIVALVGHTSELMAGNSRPLFLRQPRIRDGCTYFDARSSGKGRDHGCGGGVWTGYHGRGQHRLTVFHQLCRAGRSDSEHRALLRACFEYKEKIRRLCHVVWWVMII